MAQRVRIPHRGQSPSSVTQLPILTALHARFPTLFALTIHHVTKKVNTKYYPPDLTAIEMALSSFGLKDDEFSNYTDEELLQEKDELIKLYKRYKGEDDEKD